MARIDTVFVDMDGVVADFLTACFKIHDKDSTHWNNPIHRGKFWVNEAWGQTNEEFWRPIRNVQQFWENLPAYAHAQDLILYLESKLPKSSIYFLSAPAPYPACHAGKVSWILEHFPEYKNRLILTQHKKFLAGNNRLLVDDADHNIQQFRSYGGQAVLLPRPWNSEHGKLNEFNDIYGDGLPFELLIKKLDRILWKKKT